MTDTPLAGRTLADTLDALAAKSPAPGGGAVAPLAAAFACALARMVIAYTLGKERFAEHEPRLRRADEWLGAARDRLLALADEDAAAYARLSSLKKLPEGDPARDGLAEAEARCLAVPRECQTVAGNLLATLETLPQITNPWLASDLAIAAVLAEAATASAVWNVRVNLGAITDDSEKVEVELAAGRAASEAARTRARVEAACGGRRGT